MKRFLARLLGIRAGHCERERVRVLDLPAEWGERLRMEEARALFAHPQHEPILKAVAQLVWMNRVSAQQRAVDCAVDGRGDTRVHLGEIEMTNHLLADIRRMSAPHLVGEQGRQMPWKPTDEMAQWFEKEEG